MPTVKNLIDHYTHRLGKAGVYQPRVEAKAIVARILDIREEALDEAQARNVDGIRESLIAQAMEIRENKVPIARIFGTTSFCGLTLQTGSGVIQPYPETESLVEHALLSIDSKNNRLRLLDLGTGTGCILLALLARLPNATGLGVDINEATLDLARTNAKNCGLSARAEFRVGNWCVGLQEKFDLVVCNPPCVRTERLPYMLPEMRLHDPQHALDGGTDGLAFYRRLASGLSAIAKEDAKAFVQVGEPNAFQVKKIFEKDGFVSVTIKTNYRRLPVCVDVTNRKKSSWWRSFINQRDN